MLGPFFHSYFSTVSYKFITYFVDSGELRKSRKKLKLSKFLSTKVLLENKILFAKIIVNFEKTFSFISVLGLFRKQGNTNFCRLMFFARAVFHFMVIFIFLLKILEAKIKICNIICIFQF